MQSQYSGTNTTRGIRQQSERVQKLCQFHFIQQLDRVAEISLQRTLDAINGGEGGEGDGK